MKRANLALGAVGGILLLVVGCQSFDLGLDLAAKGFEAAAMVRTMDGAPDSVALTLKDTLKRQGFEAEISKSSDTVVVESKTAAGLKFGLVLKSARSADGRQQTNVSLEWMDNRKDQQTSVQILAEIDKQAAKK